MEVILEWVTVGILAWGLIGACCLIFLGVREDIRAYRQRKKSQLHFTDNVDTGWFEDENGDRNIVINGQIIGKICLHNPSHRYPNE